MRAVAVAYVAVVAGLAAYAFRSDDAQFGTAEATAGVLTLPSIGGLLPAIYVVGALAWRLHDAGAPMALVTVTFTAFASAAALGNVWLARELARLVRSRRG